MSLMPYVSQFFANFFELFVISAPWLLLGLLLAGVMHELIPMSLLQKHLGKNSFGSISKAAFIGAPLPLCSCGVIPAALGLRRSGASKSSTISFLVATPETGVDSVSVSYALLGPVFAIVRPIAAITSAMYAGLLVKFFGSNEPVEKHTSAEESSCCSKKQTTVCDSSEHAKKYKTSSITRKLQMALVFSTGKLLKDITFWLLFGLLMAALIQTFVPADFLTHWGDGFVAMLVMALIGIPMYICATASTPIAVGFLSVGISPGAILVFLLAGPATNMSTMGMIQKEMGKRTLCLYLIAVGSSSISLGYLLNLLFSTFNWSLPSVAEHYHHSSEMGWFFIGCAVVLGLFMIKNYLPALKANPNAGQSV